MASHRRTGPEAAHRGWGSDPGNKAGPMMTGCPFLSRVGSSQWIEKERERSGFVGPESKTPVPHDASSSPRICPPGPHQRPVAAECSKGPSLASHGSLSRGGQGRPWTRRSGGDSGDTVESTGGGPGSAFPLVILLETDSHPPWTCGHREAA